LNEGESMGKLRAVRVLTAVALAVSVSGALLAVSGPASAATKRVKATCTVLTGNAKKTTDKLSSCTPATDTGGTATGISKIGKGTTGTATLTWAGKHGVTTISYNYALVAVPKCGTSVVKGKKTNNLEVTETGKVITSTGTASKDIKVGDTTSATVCINAATSAESLLKGTKFVL
jgi:hypothetical protein